MSTTMLLKIISLCLVLPTVVLAAPYTPEDDAQILERLPRADGTAQTDVRRLQDQLRQQPDNAALAAALAWHYVSLGKTSADPRYYGYAQAALIRWWTLAAPPSEVLLVRATIRQNRHEFAAALQDLQRLLSLQPRNIQAWLTQAVVLSVIGEHRNALQSCMVLLKLSDGLLATTCISHVLSLSGHATRASQLLRETLDKYPGGDGETYRWAATEMAEIAQRLGQNEMAERYFKQALQLPGDDIYLLTAYADFLLDQQRFAEVVYLLEEYTRIDALLLRLALAEHALNPAGRSGHRDALLVRARTSARRGDTTHLGERSRFYLQLLDQPDQALTMALSNWQLQREPRDARLVLEAALAAGNPGAASGVVAWIRKTGLEDVRLDAMLAELQAESS